jgi:glycosyltransferase involved in cell wall biosynthesis
VSGSLPDIRCGIGDYTARLAAQLARRPGVSVCVLTSQNDRIRLDAAAPAEVVSQARWGVADLPELLRVIDRYAPDVIHIQYPAVGYGRRLGIVLLPLVARRLRRLPTVLTIHERRERRWAARFAINFMALASTKVVTLDPVETASLVQAIPQMSRKVVTGRMISTIALAANVDRSAWRTRLGAAADDFILVTFGLIHPRRRVEDIIDAVAELRRLNVRVRLLVVGGEAEYDPDIARAYSLQLRDRAHSLGLDGVIDWMDHVAADEVSACLQSADVAVLLYPEGASDRNTTLRAALEHGLPVVTTIGAATSDSLRHQVGIIYVSAGRYTAADLAQAVRKALTIGSDASRAATDKSNLEQQVDFHLDLYDSVAQRRTPDRRSNASLKGPNQ